MKQYLLHHFKISTIIMGCFLLLNCGSVMATPCSPVTTDTTVTIPCGTSVTVGTNQYNSSGTYVDTLTSSLGCDSIVTLNLTVQVVNPTNISQTMCAGDSFTFNGVVLYDGGTYVDSLTSSFGCDSIVTLQLNVITPLPTTVSAAICQGDIYVFGSDTLTAAGSYTDTIFSVGGCDSVEVTLTLTVNSVDMPYITEQGTTLIVSSDPNAYYFLWFVDDVPDTTALGGNYYYDPAVDGNYLVEVYDPNTGCAAFSDEYYYSFATAIRAVHGVSDLHLYPNPSSGIFEVEFSDNALKEVSVTDMLGQIIVPAKKVTQREEYDLRDLSAGVYIVKVTDLKNANQVVYQQVVVQH